MDIGYRIKQLRTKNNLTLEELASRCELTKGFLSQLERNLTSPSIATLQDIVEALGTTLAKFFQEETEEKPVSYTHLRAHETGRNLVCRLLLEKKKKEQHKIYFKPKLLKRIKADA